MASDTSPDYSKHLHRKNLTFRQAEGVHPLPKMLAYGELSKSLRVRIWDIIFLYLNDQIDDWNHNFQSEGQSLAVLLASRAMSLPADEAITLSDHPEEFFQKLKYIILSRNYADCLEVVQLIVRENFPPHLTVMLANVLNDPTSPYQVVDFPPKTIIPRGDVGERGTFEQDWPEIAASPFKGSKTHLRQSAEELNKGNYPAAMREAIHAVESAGKVITGKHGADLNEALRVIGRDKGMHPALQVGFSKLYSYANDEKGVRHALIDATNENVGREEALFFFSSCTAFVAYLARKHSGNA